MVSGLRSPQSRSENWRILLFSFCVILGIAAIFYRLFTLTVIQHTAFVQTAQSQYNSPTALISGRGSIYFSDLTSQERTLAATNKSSLYLYANNQILTSPEDIAKALAPILLQDATALTAKLNQSKSYQVLADSISQEQADRIKQLNIKGLGVSTKVDRYYSKGSLAAQVLGFVGYDGNRRVGQYGVEASYNDVLSGVHNNQNIWGNNTYAKISSWLRSLLAKNISHAQLVQDIPKKDSQGSSDLVLTIDSNVQEVAETKLNDVIKRWHADGGSAIIEEPTTGAIIAMAVSPSFDPNNYSTYDLDHYINKNVQEEYEPGSSFKPVTMSGAIDKAAVSPETTYTDTGVVNISGYAIKNFDTKAHGVMTMRQVLEKSLNTGTIFAEEHLGDDNFLNYVIGFGFGQKTGVDLPGEVIGDISNLYTGRKVNFATASFGQGIAVTPLQLINAYSVIANGGKLMRPYIVKTIIHPDGSTTNTQVKILGTPITESTAHKLQSMLTDVVDIGFDKARIPGYDVAGKTGTAQIADSKGGYLDNNQFIHNFIGFAPSYNPRFVILIKLDKPKGITFAADSLSPVFADLARFMIHYLNIPPTRK